MILEPKEIDWDADNYGYQFFREELKELILSEAIALIRKESTDFFESRCPDLISEANVEDV